MLLNKIRPTRIRLEASSVCQLSCPSCPAHGGVSRPAVGYGFLALSDFKNLVERNPRVESIELSNYGEILLNPELLDILEYAHERGVALTADTGVNLNTASDELLEGLVKYRLRSLTCSIDGAGEESYRVYRVNGDFSTVIANVKKLNAFKRMYHTDLPRLAWQFIVFGHNEREIERARALARSLDMAFYLKLAWDPQHAPVTDREALRREVGAADREEYRERFGMDYAHQTCLELWNSPQINWDGRVLGCCRNFWGDFGANAFTDGLDAAVNSSGMRYARGMLLGKRRPREGIPCTTCSLYTDMEAEGRWLRRREIAAACHPILAGTWRPSERIRRTLPYRGARFVYRRIRRRSCQGLRLASATYPLQIPLAPDEETGWKPYGVFSGSTKGLETWSCHASVLREGSCPHPPHRHGDEEILMLLSGEVDLLLPDAKTGAEGGCVRLRPGQFVYYPSDFAHTLRTTSSAPASYLMFRWSSSRRGRSRLAYGCYGPFDLEAREESVRGFSARLVFEGPTKYLGKLHCHVSTLASGQGYDSHSDEYDVGIVVMEGEVETLGERVTPHGVIVYAAGEPHGMRNPGQTTARYVVFEFHPRGGWMACRLRRSHAARVVGALGAGRRG